jgi:COP9 signalosome complex subunit 7
MHREDLIIDAIYADLLTGRLDQLKSRFYIDSVAGRDVQVLEPLATVLQQWASSIEHQIAGIDRRIADVRSSEFVFALKSQTPD